VQVVFEVQSEGVGGVHQISGGLHLGQVHFARFWPLRFHNARSLSREQVRNWDQISYEEAIYLSEQLPNVFSHVGTNRRQQQRLHLDELDDQVDVHSLQAEFSVFVTRSLQLKETGPQSLFEKHVVVVFFGFLDLQIDFTEQI